jgi:two-component system alkaline phosphatase synthesis response regulator PhoP
MPYKVLVVDDEKPIVRLITFNLEKEGFTTLKAYDGDEAMQIITNEKPDLVILDIMLPYIDGFDVCRQIRHKNMSTAVIMLTAKDQEIDKVLGLELGADDYMAKPFSPRELIARVKAVLRRTTGKKGSAHEEAIIIGDLVIDTARHEVSVSGRQVDLTLKEFELLELLAKNAGRVMTRNVLMDNIWGFTYDGDTRIVDVHISHLREKIEVNAKNPVYIKTVRGLGYKFGGANT